jgi:hypothetical protein
LDEQTTPQPDAVDQALADPASFETDGLSATAQPIPDVIQGANRQAGRAALSGTNRRGGAISAWSCTRPAKVIPPGTSYDVDYDGPDHTG